MVLPPACLQRADGTPPVVPLHKFRGQARAHLLSVGIIRPAADVTAIDVNAFLSARDGAPASAGKVAEADKGDVARFLNRCLPGIPTAFQSAQGSCTGAWRFAQLSGMYMAGKA